MIEAEYLVESPLDPEKVAAIIAGEQSSGTFVRVAGETDELRERAAARVLSLEEIASRERPSLSSAWVEAKGLTGPFRRARLRIGFPEDNVGPNLPTLAATVTGNLYDLGQVTGLRLLALDLPEAYRARFDYPVAGIAGTRERTSVHDRPFFGTIIKPNVGLRTGEIADLVETLCRAGVDFIKDDEVAANPACAPLAERIPAIMQRVRDYGERTGRVVTVAFNITDETEAMRRHAEFVEKEGGNCVMVSINWVGLAGLQTLRRSTPLMIHAHRNGYGGWARHPALGIAAQPYQVLYRLAGIDHFHVHGIGGKFADRRDEVAAAAKACGAPLSTGETVDRVLPVFSSGQWAGTLPATFEAVGSGDFMLLAGGGILAHPLGPAAGVESLKQAWEALASGETLERYAEGRPALAEAFAFYERS